jgi:hypothetical protein
VELDDYLRVEVDDCHSKKADRKLRHIQATNAAGIGNVFKRRLLQGQSASINPAASHATPDYRVAGSSLAEYGPPPIGRAPRGYTAGEGKLAAASPYKTPWLEGNRLRAW